MDEDGDGIDKIDGGYLFMAKITLSDGTEIEAKVDELYALQRLIEAGASGEEGNYAASIGESEVVSGEESEMYSVGDRVVIDAGKGAGIYPLNGFHDGVLCVVKDVCPEHEDDPTRIEVSRKETFEEAWERIMAMNNGEEGKPPTAFPLPSQIRPYVEREETPPLVNGRLYTTLIKSLHDDIPIGTTVLLTRAEEDSSGDVKVELVDGTDYDFISSKGLQELGKESADELVLFLRAGLDKGEFKVGDIAEVVHSPAASPVGSLVKVVETHGEDGVYAEGVGFSPTLKTFSYRTYNLKLVSPVESRVDIDG